MKFRKDFVTNSSSSSYICEICGCAESGWDAAPDDVGMCECECGHVFCSEHRVTASPADFLEWFFNTESLTEEQKSAIESACKDMCTEDIKEYLIENEYTDEDFFSDNELPDIECPICSFKVVSDDDLSKYKSILLNKTDEEITTEIQERFENMQEFNDFLKKNKVC